MAGHLCELSEEHHQVERAISEKHFAFVETISRLLGSHYRRSLLQPQPSLTRLSFAVDRSPPLRSPSAARRLTLLCAALAAIAAGCRPSKGPDAAKPGQPTADAKAGAEKKGPPPNSVPVETVDVVTGPISAFLRYNSTLETEASVDIYPQTGGQVDALYVEEGDRVKKGDPLLQIDDRELRVELRDAEINARHLEASFARIQELFGRKLLNQQEYDDKKFQLEQAKLRVERAKLALAHTTVRAPFDGVISARDAQAGARVTSGTKLFSLVKLDEITARVFVPGHHLAAVAENQTAIISSEFLPGRTFQGWVKRISPVIDPKSGTFKVTVGVRGEENELAPGLFVYVQIITATRDSALLIPKGAIVYEGGERYVFAVVDGKAAKRKLDLGFEGIDHLEALSGFEPGTPIVVRGQNGLKDGAAVHLVNAPPAVKEPSTMPATETATAAAPKATKASAPAAGS
jgi:membrane fusion protein, multidrug efflux system